MPTPADDPRWGQLSAPFPAPAISKMPRTTCRACSDSQRKVCDRHTWVNRCSECSTSHSSASIHLEYVGHADVTARLDEVDPHWEWNPAYHDVDPHLLAAALATGNPEMLARLIENSPAKYTDDGLWIRLTVLGVTRLGFGDAQGKRGPNATKELIGDAIRNAAMRFGVATYLWSKSEAAQAMKDGPDDSLASTSQVETASPPPAQRQTATRARGGAKGQDTKGAEKTSQALAEAGARKASAASTVELVDQILTTTPKACTPLNVRPVISDEELAAAAAYYPALQSARAQEHIPFWGWLAACKAVIDQNGTSVRDAAALAGATP